MLKLFDRVQQIHNTTSSYERLFAGQQSSFTLRSLYTNALGSQHYSINLLLYVRTVQDKYISLYKELITQLYVYMTAIRVLAKGYLPILPITPLKLKDVVNEVKIAIRKTKPDYDLVIDRLHLYYDMKLVMFGIDIKKNSHNTISSIYTTIYTTASDIMPNRHCTSSNYRSKQTSSLLHTYR